MPRINLSISNELFSAMEQTANKKNIPINLVAISALEQIFLEEQVDYTELLNKMLKDIDNLPKEKKEFILFDLPSFKSINVATCKDGIVKPTTLRARLGKAFNELVRTDSVKGVSRATTIDIHGKEALKFDHRAAVYAIDWNIRNS